MLYWSQFISNIIILYLSMSTETARLQKIAEFYDSETGSYDAGYSSDICKAEDAIVAELLSPITYGKVLDIGAGSGLLCEMFDIDDYFGIELSPQMTSQAKKKFPHKNFSIADMHRLPFNSDRFDAVISLYGPISYSLTPEELINEITRVTKPGGTVALMPYTLRVGLNLEIGGYSTATEKSIEKIFYTGKKLKEILSGFENVIFMV